VTLWEEVAEFERIQNETEALPVVYGLEIHSENIQIDGKTFRHYVGCSCSAFVTFWPCGEVQP
jgi:hypothetical protein